MTAKPLHIYVAGPYSATSTHTIAQNLTEAIETGVEVLRKGHYPYIPHLTHFVDMEKRKPLSLTWDDHLDWGLAWLDRSDALLYMGKSRGADIELEYAIGHGKIVFRSVKDIPTLDHRRYYVDPLNLVEK